MHSYLIKTLLIALAYYISGSLSLLLAIPPGFAAPVWPAAGIALAAILLWGYRFLPAVFIGSFCTNLFIASNSGANVVELLPLIVSSSIAVGATLQAALSAFLVNRAITIPNRLEQELDVLKIILLGGLIGCLVNSLIGTLVLFGAGFISSDAFLIGWLTWWVGDSIGVILVTPIIIMLSSGGVSVSRKYLVALPITLVFVLVVGVFHSARESEQKATIDTFTKLTLYPADLIRNQFTVFREALSSIKNFHQASQKVDKDEFAIFVDDKLKENPEISSLMWVPRVKKNEIQTFEANAVKDGLENFTIWEGSPGSKTSPRDSDEYYPVHYSLSLKNNKEILGLNLGANPAFLNAFREARDNGKQAVIELNNIFPKGSILLYQPIYKNGVALETTPHRKAAFTGGVLINFDIARLIEKRDVGYKKNHYNIHILEKSSEGKKLTRHGSKANPPAFSHEASFTVSGKEWVIVFTPTSKFFTDHQGWLSWLVLVGGLLFTSLLQIFLLSLTARTEVVQRLVKTKTNALAHSEEQFRSAMQYSAVGMSLVSTGGHWIKVNKALCEIVGYTHSELLEMEYNSLIYPDDMDENQSLLNQLLNGEIETFQLEHRIVHKKGHSVWISASISAVWDKAKKPKYFICQTRNISERKKAEEEREELSKTLSLILDNAGEGIYGLDLDGNTTFTNKTALKMVGYTLEEMLNVSQHKLIHHHYPDGTPYPREDCNIYAAFKDGNTRTEDKEVFWHKNGTAIPVEYTSSPILDEKDNISGAVVVFKDISERREAEKALNEYHQFQDLIMKTVPGMVFVKDDEFKIIQANEEFINVYPPEQRDRVIGYTTLESYDPKDAEEFLKNDIQALEEGYSEVEETLTFPDGAVRTLLTKKVRFTNADNKRYILGHAYDITELRQKDQKLSASEAKHRAVLENTVDGLITVTSRGIIEGFNPASEKIFGYTAKEVTGRNIKILMPSPDREQHDQYLKDYENTGQKKIIGISREVTALRKDGTEFPIELSISEINLDGQVLYSGIVRDITERKHAEEELTRSNLELERFAYIASHDLQEPLRMVSSFTNLIQEEYHEKLDDKAQKYMGFIANASQRMQDLVRDLLDYSRADQSVPKFENIECNHLVKTVLEALAEVIEETKAEVTFDPMPEVYSNPIRISRLLQNIIGNAIKYKREGVSPRIHVGVEDKQECWTFSVSDNGIGIKPEYLDQVFVLFKRLHNKDEYAGTGIGLAICKKIVESIGGKIWIESEFGSGSTFYFNILKSEPGKEAA
ncbi:MAG: PAS domain S-box protein [Methyloligellaceae bacterium]